MSSNFKASEIISFWAGILQQMSLSARAAEELETCLEKQGLPSATPQVSLPQLPANLWQPDQPPFGPGPWTIPDFLQTFLCSDLQKKCRQLEDKCAGLEAEVAHLRQRAQASQTEGEPQSIQQAWQDIADKQKRLLQDFMNQMANMALKDENKPQSK